MSLRLTERNPGLSAQDLVRRFVPPRRFGGVRFETYVPDPAHPSQAEALAEMERFAAEVGGEAGAGGDGGGRRRWWGRRAAPPPTAAGRGGRYLDGGFGVGKTHLLAALWHEAPGPKAYLSFAELTAVIGFLGMEEALASFAGHRLVCLDEFELDDVANTLMTVTFLRSVVGGSGATKVAATSNTLPGQQGEGRFSAEDFRREIAAVADHFEVVRVDGPDYRARSRRLATAPFADAELDALDGDRASDDRFGELLAHLRRVHPVRFGALVAGLDVVRLRGLAPIDNQGAALLFVALVDELYDAEVAVAATGCAVGELFPSSYRGGGYRKKYGRCESRLAALMGEARALLAQR